jgi:four helix bundle protein
VYLTDAAGRLTSFAGRQQERELNSKSGIKYPRVHPTPALFRASAIGTIHAAAALMDKILSLRDLDVWQLGMDLADSVIADLRLMPRTEFDLRRQMQRAAISIPANVAEGWRRKKRRGAYQNHVSIAMGSQGELDTELEIAFRNGFLKHENCARSLELCGRVGLMLNRLHDSLD